MLSSEEAGIILLSLKIAFWSVALSLPLAFAVAYLLARAHFPGKTLVDALVHLPLVLPPGVIGFALLTLFGKRGAIGAPLHDWFGIVFAFKWTGAALASGIMGFPLMVRAIRLSLAAIEVMVQRLWPDCGHVVVALPDPRKGEQIVLITDGANVASQRVAMKVGFQREGVTRSHLLHPDGRRRDS